MIELVRERFQKTLDKLNEFSEPGEGINRLTYTKIEDAARHFLIDQFKQEDMEVKIDAIGNIIARREGADPDLPAVAFGSHFDSVYEAGEYDGAAGVVAALEVIRELNEDSVMTEFPLEVIAFTGEESARFGFSTLGSRAMAGLLDPVEIADLKDNEGKNLREAMEEIGFNINDIHKARRQSEDLYSFTELHIEQGPILEEKKKDIGIVTSIAAPVRYRVEIRGQSSHSGTTPMGYRKDAFLGACEISLEIEKKAIKESENNTVATVGNCKVFPGAMNIVPGHVEMKIDIRSYSVTSRKQVVEHLFKTIDKIKDTRELDIKVYKISEEFPVKMDKHLMEILKVSCEKNGLSYEVMPSGAGHDAMNMAKLCPSNMIFIPSKNGLSHNPHEYSSIVQLAAGTKLLKEHILSQAKVMKRKELSTNERK